MALPYFEKAYIVGNQNRNELKTLVSIYHWLRLLEQKEVAQKVLDGEKGYKIIPVSDIDNLIYMEK